MATYSEQCWAVGSYRYASYFTLYVELTEKWVDISNNTSYVDYNVYCQSSGSGSISANHFKYFSLNDIEILNTTEHVSASSPNAYIHLCNGTIGPIYHNNDGTKSIEFYAEIEASSYGVASSVGGIFYLSTIPRTSSISATSANIEETTAININRASDSFTHTITYSFSGLSGTIATKTGSTSLGWTIPSSFYAKIPNAKSGTVTLTCTTYNGNTSIGTSTCTFTAIASESRCKPTLTATVIDTNSTTIALTGSNAKLIRYKSTAKVTASPTARNSASISKVTVNGTTINNNTISIANCSATSFSVVATDSRGYSTTVNLTPTVVNYIPLTINANAFRPSPTTGEIDLEYSGNYFNGDFGSSSNTLTVSWKYRVRYSGSYTDGTISIAPTITNNTYKLNQKSLGTIFTYTNVYEIQITAQDKLTTINTTIVVPQGIPIVNWGEDFFNVNGTITQNGTAEVLSAEVLYEDDTGTTGTVTLSETSANFRYLEIFYSKSGIFQSVKIYSPNGKKVSLIMGYINSSSEAQLQLAKITINGTQITRDNSSGYINFNTNSHYMGLNQEVGIHRVLGYR